MDAMPVQSDLKQGALIRQYVEQCAAYLLMASLQRGPPDLGLQIKKCNSAKSEETL